MKFIHRLGYYLGGFSIGLIVLAFFLSGKKTTCDYSPDARVLKNIRQKERVYSESALDILHQHQIDTAMITSILRNGDVDFSNSNTELDTCKLYQVNGMAAEMILELMMENCDSLVTVQNIVVKN